MSDRSPTSGDAGSIFDHALVKAAGLVLQPPDRGRMELLRDLDSPDLGLRSVMYRIHAEPDWLATFEGFGDVSRFTDEEAAEFCMCFTRPIAECKEALWSGRTHFREEAMRIVGNVLPEIILEQLLLATLGVMFDRCTASANDPANTEKILIC